jgi:hypothetical protein
MRIEQQIHAGPALNICSISAVLSRPKSSGTSSLPS